jgi:hypothetical protein
MRILSSFSDYYDAGIAYGVDRELTFVRETSTHMVDIPREAKNIGWRVMIDHERGRRRFKDQDRWNYRSQHYLHFCGKIYPFYYFDMIKYRDPKNGRVFEVNGALNAHRNMVSYDEVSRNRIFIWNEETALTYFEPGKQDWYNKFDYSQEWNVISDDRLNRKYNSPVVLEYIGRNAGRRIDLVVNPCLKDMNFKDVIDPYTAFQEVSMYLAMLQNPEDKDLDPAATDVEKIRQHGMDEKYGFRKPPSK